jgi:Tfp pilus assembly protein PilN
MKAVNLLPADQREGAGGAAGRSQGAAYAVLAVLAGVALLALLYGQAHRQVSSRNTRLASLNARTQQVQAQAGGLAAYTSFTSLREERERAVSQLVDSRFDWAHSLHELGRVLPSTASIATIEGAVGSTAGNLGSGSAKTTSSATPVSATPPGSVPTVTLTGCATSQAQVAVTLNRLRLIDGVSEVTLQSSTSAGAGSAGAGAGGGCPPGGPSFTATLTFDSLPAAGAASASTAAVAGGGAR